MRGLEDAIIELAMATQAETEREGESFGFER